MSAPLDLVAFVTRSENRLAVLSTLASGDRTRRALEDETGIPRATVSRILADSRDRDLVVRDGHTYATTPLGDCLAEELDGIFDTIETMAAVQSLAAMLPLEEIGLTTTELAAGEVISPTPIDPMAPVKRAAAVVEASDHVRTFCYSVVHAPILAALRAVSAREQQLVGVVASDVLEVVASDPELASAARELFRTGNVDMYIYDDGIEPQLIIADERTMFLVTDSEGTIQGLVESTDESLQDWAIRFFERLKREADPITPARATELLTP